jgi:hypothetical protein
MTGYFHLHGRWLIVHVVDRPEGRLDEVVHVLGRHRWSRMSIINTYYSIDIDLEIPVMLDESRRKYEECCSE